ncbi:MAG: permease, partial [Candidatus Thermoplasmatota archaeon]|nr:permease [Candidatus Thermoplasmatota archaeon]
MQNLSDVLLFGLTLHNMIALGVIIYTIWAFISSFLRKRSKELDDWLQKRSLDKLVPDDIKWYFMFGFAVACVFLYLYCWLCQFYGLDGPGDDRFFLDWVFRDLLGILPWFVWGCILAGFINKYLYLGKLRLPKSMVGAGFFASIIPICSCAAVPIAHGMMLGKQMRLRAVITFLIVVPVLSPVVYILAISQIGIVYLITEIIAVFALAFTLGIIIEKYAGVKDETNPKAGCFTCEGCSTSHMLKHRTSALLSSWDQFHYLLKFILFGIIIGGFFATLVDPDAISAFFGTQGDALSSLPGLIIIVSIAIPLYICSGTDVIILAPL